MATKLTAAQLDRAMGVMVGLASGDALGAGYEFQPPRIRGEAVEMHGGGGFQWAPGEWTDDTSMAVIIATVAATGADVRSTAALDQITAGFVAWARTAKDVGNQTRSVLGRVASDQTSSRAHAVAREEFERTDLTGNGSLMRTSPVAIAYLDDPDGLVAAAHAVSALTHGDTEAGEACALWCLAIRHAVLHGTLDGLRLALDHLPADRAAVWAKRLDDAETVESHEIPSNGWVVAALMAAWSAITRTPVPRDDPEAGTHPAQHLANALDAAVRCGNDTDTVAAIAGSLLGARWGVSAVPLQWRRILHGWPGLRSRDLIALAMRITGASTRDDKWPHVRTVDYSSFGDLNGLATHPHDACVLIGGVGAVRSLPAGVDAVVSLCRIGSAEVPAAGVRAEDHVEVWLIDDADPALNAHLEHVLADAADAVAAYRQEGRTVLLHCVQAQSRTPTVAALYAMRRLGIPRDQALADIKRTLPAAHPNPAFLEALRRLEPKGQ